MLTLLKFEVSSLPKNPRLYRLVSMYPVPISVDLLQSLFLVHQLQTRLLLRLQVLRPGTSYENQRELDFVTLYWGLKEWKLDDFKRVSRVLILTWHLSSIVVG